MTIKRTQHRVCRNCGHPRRNHPAEGPCTARDCECVRFVAVGEAELWVWVQSNDDADTAPVTGRVVAVRVDAAMPAQVVPLMASTREEALAPLMKAMAESHAHELGVDVRLVHFREVDDE